MGNINSQEHSHPYIDSAQKNGELENVIGRTVFVQIYKDILDAGGFTRSGDSIVPIQADPEIVKNIVNSNYSRLTGAGSNTQEQSQVALPQDYDGDKEVKQTEQAIITLLHKSGILSLDILKSTAKYAGPGNIKYLKGDLNHTFRSTKAYNEVLYKINPYHRPGEPLPVISGNRNDFFVTEIAEEGLLSGANLMKKAGELAGLKLSTEDVIKLSLIDEVGHEYGHAIHRGIQLMGIPTLERAISKGYIRSYDIVSPDVKSIHDEHMAEGFADISLVEYLREKMGYSPEQIKSLQEALHGEEYFLGEAAYVFFDYATSKGFTPKEIGAFSTALLIAAHTNFSNDQNLYLWRLDGIVEYHTRPYSKEQIVELIKH